VTTQKRPYGSDSIRQIGENHYQVQARFGWSDTKNGYERVRRNIRGTKKDAMRALREIRAEHEAERAAPENPDFDEVARRYLQVKIARGQKESTELEYRRNIATHFTPTLGSLPVREIRSAQIEDLVSSWQSAGRAPNTVRRLHKQLKAILSWAVRMDFIPQNPAARVEPPKRADVSLRVLSADEAQILLRAAQGTRLYPILRIALETGARQGELLELRWGDISFENATLRIERSVRQAGGRVMVTAPKTKASRRTIPLSAEAVELLRACRAQAGQASTNDLVFPSSVGGYWDPPNLRRALRSLTDSVGIGGLRFHDLRHTAASLMEQAGVPISAIAAQLGHSSAAFTYATYVHPSPTTQVAAAVTMGRVLGLDEAQSVGTSAKGESAALAEDSDIEADGYA